MKYPSMVWMVDIGNARWTSVLAKLRCCGAYVRSNRHMLGDEPAGAIALLYDLFKIAALPAPLLACVMVTASANAEVERMPAFLANDDWVSWLDENSASPNEASRPPRGRRHQMDNDQGRARGPPAHGITTKGPFSPQSMPKAADARLKPLQLHPQPKSDDPPGRIASESVKAVGAIVEGRSRIEQVRDVNENRAAAQCAAAPEPFVRQHVLGIELKDVVGANLVSAAYRCAVRSGQYRSHGIRTPVTVAAHEIVVQFEAEGIKLPAQVEPELSLNSAEGRV